MMKHMENDPDDIRAQIERVRRNLGTTPADAEQDNWVSASAYGKAHEEVPQYLSELSRVSHTIDSEKQFTQDSEIAAIFDSEMLADAESRAVKLMFGIAGAGLLIATGVVASSLWSILDSSTTALALLMLAALVGVWLVSFGFVKSKLIRTVSHHRTTAKLMALENVADRKGLSS